ncbi:DUF4352 domain-containing protein [Georgenia satyanarayanai]|uniref:DUF4352 domain-containing protein n=1 Tax=Georgenia satyanarayanai TaxID=860221 RepID=UPI0012641DFB
MDLDWSDTFLNDINPGNTVEGIVVFDIPADAQPAAIELRRAVHYAETARSTSSSSAAA